jgi:hypothetical protein
MLNIRRMDHETSGTHCWRIEVRRQFRMHPRKDSEFIIRKLVSAWHIDFLRIVHPQHSLEDSS